MWFLPQEISLALWLPVFYTFVGVRCNTDIGSSGVCVTTDVVFRNFEDFKDFVHVALQFSVYGIEIKNMFFFFFVAMSEEVKRSKRLKQKKENDPIPAPIPHPAPPPSHIPLHQSPNPVQNRKTKTRQEISADYRQKRKEDIERYTQYLEKNRVNCKAYRESMKGDEEKRQQNNERARQRMAKMREKRKLQQISANTPQKVKTRNDRNEEEMQRKQWREEKRKQRSNYSSQKRTAINKKRREKRLEQKLAREREGLSKKTNSATTQTETPLSSSAPSPASSSSWTPNAQRTALSRARKSMPKNPQQFAETWTQLAEKATPRKKHAIQEKQMYSQKQARLGHLLQETIQRLRNKSDHDSRVMRSAVMQICQKYGSVRTRSKVLSLNRKTLIRQLKKKTNRRKERNEELTKEVGDFFEKSATYLPDQKHVVKGKAKQALNMPLKDLHEQYTKGGGKAAFSTFARCRPAHVRKMVSNQLRQCLCEYCANADIKIHALNEVAAKVHPPAKLRHIYHAVKVTTCERGTKDCQYRQCGACGPEKLTDFLAPLRDHTGMITWHEWTTKKITRKGKESSRKVLLKRSGSVEEILTELRTDIAFLSEHLFRANWQHEQFEQVRTASPFPSNLVAAVLDFAENYTCLFQDEVQAAHWNHEQVTLHPIATYYKCRHCQERVYESLVFISPDQRHDHHAVHTFFTIAFNHLQVERKLTPELILQWTDGCSAQYKSKGPFSDISSSVVDFGTRVERCFFGSRHGKGPCDGEAAVVKHHVATAVKGKKTVVANARDFYDYAISSSLNKQPVDDNTCQHFLRTFFWVPEEKIERNRPDRNVKTVKGTREFHHIKSGGQGRLTSRHLTCVCMSCLFGVGMCANTDIVGPWQVYTLVPDDKSRPQCSSPHSQAPSHGPQLQRDTPATRGRRPAAAVAATRGHRETTTANG